MLAIVDDRVHQGMISTTAVILLLHCLRCFAALFLSVGASVVAPAYVPELASDKYSYCKFASLSNFVHILINTVKSWANLGLT